jgi:hypothetical protein
VVVTVLLGLAFACDKTGSLPNETANSESGTSTTEESDGSDTNATETETGDELPDCDPSLLDMCESQTLPGLEGCFAACACDDLDCATACNAAFADNYWACAGPLCAEGEFGWPGSGSCFEVCDARQLTCVDVNGCGANMCEYQWLDCADRCDLCTRSATFEYTYEDSCTIVLPGPPTGVHVPFVRVAVGDEQQTEGPMGVGCDDPEGYDVVWVDPAQLLLCPTACDAFVMSGLAEVTYGAPPCE